MASQGLRLGSVAYEALIDAAGSRSLGHVLLQIARQSTPVEEVFGYWFNPDTGPRVITSLGTGGSAHVRAQSYATKYHGLDPLVPSYANCAEGGPTRTYRLNAVQIGDLRYRHECFDRPQLQEKLSFVRQRAGRLYVLNFYQRTFCGQSLEPLSELAELALPIIRKHSDWVGGAKERPVLEQLIGRMQTVFPRLTPRERAVCARTITGMTAEAIGLELEIRPSTVLTYRRRAYERYGISSSSQLLPHLLEH